MAIFCTHMVDFRRPGHIQQHFWTRLTSVSPSHPFTSNTVPFLLGPPITKSHTIYPDRVHARYMNILWWWVDGQHVEPHVCTSTNNKTTMLRRRPNSSLFREMEIWITQIINYMCTHHPFVGLEECPYNLVFHTQRCAQVCKSGGYISGF